jgi:hypothetical protein
MIVGSLFGWCAAAIASFYITVAVSMWLETRMFLGATTRQVRSDWAALVLATQMKALVRGGRVLLGCCIGVGTIGLAATRHPMWLSVLIVGGGLRYWLWVRITTPPAVLFLSSSTQRSLAIQRFIKRCISPMRVVALLDLDTPASDELRSELGLDCLRTPTVTDWREVVMFVLNGPVPIVVVDASVGTAGVHEEIQQLVGTNQLYRTIFLADDGRVDSVPGLHLSREEACVVHGLDLGRALNKLVAVGRPPSLTDTVRVTTAIGMS